MGNNLAEITDMNNMVNSLIGNLRTLNLVQQNTYTNMVINIQAVNDSQDEAKDGAIEFRTILDNVTSGAKKLASMSDEFAKTAIQLENVNDKFKTTGNLQNSAIATASRLGAKYTDVAGQIAKVGAVTGDTFKSTDEILAFTELLNKTAAIGGNTGDDQAGVVNTAIDTMAGGAIDQDAFSGMAESMPMISTVIEDYMSNVQGAEGSLNDWLNNGMITADVFKNAMFNSATEIEGKFSETPMSWSQIWTTATNNAIMAIQPLLEFISMLAANWSTLEPIVMGVAGAIGFLILAIYGKTAALMLAQNAWNLLSIAVSKMPLMFIAIIIGIIIMQIFKWIQAVGGISVAWLILKGTVINAINAIKVGGFKVAYAVASTTATIMSNILNFVQDIVNEVIAIINSAIIAINTTFNKNISTINPVTFGTDFESSAKKYLEGLEAAVKDAENEAKIAKTTNLIEVARARRDVENKAKEAEVSPDFANAPSVPGADAISSDESVKNMAADVGGIYNNTGQIAEQNSQLTDEMRDDLLYSATANHLQEYGGTNINLDFTNYSTINSDMDIDYVVKALTNRLRESVANSAEGVPLIV